MFCIKVSSHSSPNSVAGAIAGTIRSEGEAEVQAIGAGATNQAIKAVAIARDYLGEEYDLICRPRFTTITIEEDERTAISLICERSKKSAFASEE